MSPKPKPLNISPEDLEKVLQRKRQHEASKIKVSPEELFIAEFGYYFGWQAMQSIHNNETTMEDAQVMLAGARKVWAGKMIDLASVFFTASVSAQAGKKARDNMNKGLKEFIKEAKADM